MSINVSINILYVVHPQHNVPQLLGLICNCILQGNEHLSQVDRVLCLVLDEADRLVEKGHYEELTKLLELLNK